jgi:ABC-2 type transport system ATP-binding protein
VSDLGLIGRSSIPQLIRALVGEGRTVVLSSHILDEVEKTCDYVAIVDRGEIVAMGLLAELQGEGKPRVLIGVDGTAAALEILAAVPGVSDIESENGVIQASVTDPDVIPELNGRLVEAGLPVRRLEPVRASLEERFPRDHVTAWRRGMTAAAAAPAARVRPFGLARADLLKLRKRRGLFWTAAGLIVGQW